MLSHIDRIGQTSPPAIEQDERRMKGRSGSSDGPARSLSLPDARRDLLSERARWCRRESTTTLCEGQALADGEPTFAAWVKIKSAERGDRSSMVRRYSVLLIAALVAAPFIGSGSAGAAGTVIGKCTSVKGSTHLVPGLGHDHKSQTGTSPDTGGNNPGPTPDTFSGCSMTGGGGPSSATFTSSITSTMPLGCPHILDPSGPPDGTTHIVWNSGPATNGSVKVKQTANVGQVKVITKFTSGQFFLAGHTTKAKVVFMFSIDQTSFDCTTAGNPNPIAHVNIVNQGDAVTTRV